MNRSETNMNQNANDISRISQGTCIRGEMRSSSDLRIDGAVDGVLCSEGRIVAGEDSRLSGKILCTNADIWGKVRGDLYVKDLLTLKSTSEIEGNLYVRRIQVELGVRINGSIKMITEQEFEQQYSALSVRDVPGPAEQA